MAKKMIIKGVGTIMARRYTPGGTDKSEVITLGTLQNLKIDMAVETEDIFGGDGSFPIDDLVKSKNIEITATDAKFDLSAVSLMMGDKLEEDVDSYVWELNEIHTLDESKAITLNHTIYTGSEDDIAVRDMSTGKPISSDDYTVTKTDEQNTTVKITFDELSAGTKVYVNYKRPSLVAVVRLMKDTVPFTVSVVHHGVFTQKNGKRLGIETELYACKAKGNFTIDAQRATASASSITLGIVDPEIDCGMLGVIKTFEVPEVTCVPPLV